MLCWRLREARSCFDNVFVDEEYSEEFDTFSLVLLDLVVGSCLILSSIDLTFCISVGSLIETVRCLEVVDGLLLLVVFSCFCVCDGGASVAVAVLIDDFRFLERRSNTEGALFSSLCSLDFPLPCKDVAVVDEVVLLLVND